jgi:hypothetical protein
VVTCPPHPAADGPIRLPITVKSGMTEAAKWASAFMEAVGPDKKRMELTRAANAAVYELPDPVPDIEHDAGTLFFYSDDSYLSVCGWTAREVSLEDGMRALGMLDAGQIATTLRHPVREVRATAIASLRDAGAP